MTPMTSYYLRLFERPTPTHTNRAEAVDDNLEVTNLESHFAVESHDGPCVVIDDKSKVTSREESKTLSQRRGRSSCTYIWCVCVCVCAIKSRLSKRRY